MRIFEASRYWIKWHTAAFAQSVPESFRQKLVITEPYRQKTYRVIAAGRQFRFPPHGLTRVGLHALDVETRR